MLGSCSRSPFAISTLLALTTIYHTASAASAGITPLPSRTAMSAAAGLRGLCSSADAKVLSLRKDILNGDSHIHFNNAGASPTPVPIVEAMKGFLDAEAEFGGYFVQNSNSASLDAVYDSIGRLIHAEKPHDEIALVDSATTAWNRILYSLPLEKGDIILVSLIEYAANYVALLQLQKRFGIEIEVIPSDKTGRASVQAFEEMMYRLGEKVRAVSITWIPTNGGVVAPAEAIGKVCAAAKSTRKSDKPLFYLVDACQAAGHIPIDVNKLHCDALSATGRKYLRGPRGTGFLYVRHESLNAFQEPITIDHHAAPWIAKQEYTLLPSAKRFEQWERNIVGVLGLGLAVDYYLGRVGVDWAHQRINALAAKLRIKLEQLDPVSVMDLGAADSQCGIVTFTISGVEAKKIKALLQAANIYVTVSSPSSTLLDAIDRSLDDVVRASLHYFNTEEEIDEFCKQVQLIATKT